MSGSADGGDEHELEAAIVLVRGRDDQRIAGL
jgi:hypothetical protein